MKRLLAFVMTAALMLSVFPLGVVALAEETVAETFEATASEPLITYDFNNNGGFAYKRYISTLEYTDGAAKLINVGGSGSVWFAKDPAFGDAVNHYGADDETKQAVYDQLLRLDANVTYKVSFNYKFLAGSNKMGVQLMFAPDITATLNAAAPTDWSFMSYVEKNFTAVELPEGETELSADTEWYTASYTFTVGAQSINLGIRPVAYNKGEVCNALVDDVVIEKCSSVTLSYTVADGEATVTGCDTASYGWLTVPETLGGSPVTAVADAAFRGCSDIYGFSLPDSIINIGAGAFDSTAYYNNEENWENGVLYIDSHLIGADEALSGECVVKDGTLTVAEEAFENCVKLTSLTLPASVKAIGSFAFLGCDALCDLYISDLENWCGMELDFCSNPMAFAENVYADNVKLEGTLTVPEGVTYIADFAFNGLSSVTTVVIPDSVKTVGAWAFSDCDGLSAVSFGNGITELKKAAFNNCTALLSVTLPDNINTVGAYAFHKCTAMVSLTLGNGVTQIGECAFYNCESLAGVYVSDLNVWAKTDFANIDANPLWYAETLYLNGEKLAGDIVLSDTLTEVSDGAFYGLTEITSITIPDSVERIGDLAFYGCTGLSSVTFGQKVENIGPLAFFGCSSLTEIDLPASLSTVGDGAFSGCSGITEAVIPAGVTEIGVGVFSGCSALETITVEEGNTVYHSEGNCLIDTENKLLIAGCKNSVIPTDGSVTAIGHSAFLGCAELDKITIPETIVSIGEAAFADCAALTDITVPDSVTELGDHVFSGCSALTSAVIGNGVTAVGERAFYGCLALESVTLGGSVSGIGEAAFSGCATLTSVNIPDSVTVIGNSAFYACEKLGTVTIGNRVTAIGHEAFYGCKSLISAVIGEKVENIGTNAFYNCTSLNSIIIPNSVTCMGDSVFGGCSALSAAAIGNGVTAVADYTFNGCSALSSVTLGNGITVVGEGAFKGCAALTEADLPEGVTVIGVNAFYNCSKLNSVNIPDGLTTIERSAFYGCSSLKDIVLPEGLETVAMYAFYGCSSLVEINIPYGINTIKEYTFNGCTALSEVYIPYTVLTVGTNAFYGCDGITVVYFGRNESEWGEIASAVSSGNDALNNAIHVFRAYAPVVQSVEKNTVVLEAVEGYEYSINGTDWQQSNVFEDLAFSTEYNMYCRVAATETAKAGEISPATAVATQPEIDIDGNGVLDEDDCIYLLYNYLFGDELYPLPESVDADVNADGSVSGKDAVYLLYHNMFGDETYPLYPEKEDIDVSGGSSDDKDQGFGEWVPIG